MALSIELAQESDTEDIHKIMQSCTKWLSDQDMMHWENVYPLFRVKLKVTRKISYLLKVENNIVGTIIIDDKKIIYHKEDEGWKEPDEKAFYISGLAVLPEHMGKGYATNLLDFADKKVKEEGGKYIRFDVVSHYKKLIQFYSKRGYEIVSTRETGKYESVFFEKSL